MCLKKIILKILGHTEWISIKRKCKVSKMLDIAEIFSAAMNIS